MLGTSIAEPENMPADAPDIFPHIWMDHAAYAIAGLHPPWAVRIEARRRHWIYRVRRGSCAFESLRGSPQATHLERDDIIGITNDFPHAFRDRRNTSIPKNPAGLRISPSACAGLTPGAYRSVVYGERGNERKPLTIASHET